MVVKKGKKAVFLMINKNLASKNSLQNKVIKNIYNTGE